MQKCFTALTWVIKGKAQREQAAATLTFWLCAHNIQAATTIELLAVCTQHSSRVSSWRPFNILLPFDMGSLKLIMPFLKPLGSVPAAHDRV